MPTAWGTSILDRAGEITGVAAEARIRALFASGLCAEKKCQTIRDRMSDMSSNRITVRIPETLNSRLRSRSRAIGTSESELVREALESYLGNSSQGRTAYELAEEAGIVGVAQRAPKDLSTNRRHFKGFGKSK